MNITGPKTRIFDIYLLIAYKHVEAHKFVSDTPQTLPPVILQHVPAPPLLPNFPCPSSSP